MTKPQFSVLLLVSIIVSGLMLGHLWLIASNNRIGNQLSSEQSFVGNAQQLEPVLDRLAKRIAMGSEKDPRLKNVLAKHGLQVTLEVDGKKKNYP